VVERWWSREEALAAVPLDTPSHRTQLHEPFDTVRHDPNLSAVEIHHAFRREFIREQP
jgi:hypothetical protein